MINLILYQNHKDSCDQNQIIREKKNREIKPYGDLIRYLSIKKKKEKSKV
jgi:hypothetical protein